MLAPPNVLCHRTFLTPTDGAGVWLLKGSGFGAFLGWVDGTVKCRDMVFSGGWSELLNRENRIQVNQYYELEESKQETGEAR